MPYPTYQSMAVALDELSLYTDRENTINTGLLYERYIDIWPDFLPDKTGCKEWVEVLRTDWRQRKKDYLDRLNAILHKQKDAESLLHEYCKRRWDMVQSLRGRVIRAKTDWRLILGLGGDHPLETGFIWHRTLGLPYLPGSSVKGMTRALAELTSTKEEAGLLLRLFGDMDKNGCGSLVFLDGLPTMPPELEIDVMNVHYAPYYRDPSKPPADYYSPTPIFFLAVASGQEFEFAILPREKGVNEEEIDRGIQYLKDGFENLGIGAKTAVGYGYFLNVHAVTDWNEQAVENKREA